jgi:hypothetical protein
MARATRREFTVGQEVMVCNGRPSRYSPQGYWQFAVVAEPDVFEGRRSFYGSRAKRHYVRVQYVNHDGTVESWVHGVLNARNAILSMEDYEPIKAARLAREQREREQPAREAAERMRECGFYAREIIGCVQDYKPDGGPGLVEVITQYLVETFEKTKWDADARSRYIATR